jgi:hypothetical protein
MWNLKTRQKAPIIQGFSYSHLPIDYCNKMPIHKNWHFIIGLIFFNVLTRRSQTGTAAAAIMAKKIIW